MISKIAPTGRGERLILFTLVDLLVQIIFFGLFVLVLFQSTQQELPTALNSKLAPYAPIAQAELVSFVDAVSRLVPLQDVDKTSSIGNQEDRVRSELASLTAALQTLQGESDIRTLKELGAELRAKHLGINDLTALNQRYISMTPQQRIKLVSAAQTIEMPRCFGGAAAFSVVEVGGGGYVVSGPIAPIARAFSSAVSGLPRVGEGYALSQEDLPAFGHRLNDAFRQCNIFVRQTSLTNSLNQYQLLNEYFLLE